MREKELIYTKHITGWTNKREEAMWAKDKICFQRLVLNEMKQNTNTDKWVAGMIRTEIEVARTTEAWMQRRGGLKKRPREEKERTSSALYHQQILTITPELR